MRPIPSPDDPIAAIIGYLLVFFAMVVCISGSRNAKDRTLRLFFLYLIFVLFEVVLKRAAHYAWYVYPIKYILLLLVLSSWFFGRDPEARNQGQLPLKGVVTVYLLLALLQTFNPIQTSPLVGLLGWLSDFVYVFLYFVAFDLMSDVARIRRFLWLTAWLGILSGLACFAEEAVGVQWLMETYPTFVQPAYFTKSGVMYRPMSLSPYVEVFALAAMVTLLSVEKVRHRLVPVIGIVVSVIANLLHAVRIIWATGILFLAAFFLLSRKKTIFPSTIVLTSVWLAIQIGVSVTEGQILIRLTSMTTPINTFQESRLWGLMALPDIVRKYPFGVGVGESSPGLRFIGDSSEFVVFGTHNYLTELAAQMSAVGPVLMLWFSVGILWLGLRGLHRISDSDLRAYTSGMLSLLAAITASFFIGGGLGAYPSNEYFWFVAGTLMRTVMSGNTALGKRDRTLEAAGLILARHRRIGNEMRKNKVG
jgi:hypothetical protein